MKRACRSIVLIGFMAAGKSTVGRTLATALDWRFIDLDEEIERRAGITIAEIFRTRGEPAFRALESSLTDELSSGERFVLATGGGWITREDALAALPRHACVVWLRIDVEEAVRRAVAAPGLRPLLAGTDPLGTARELYAAREPLYRQAHITIDVGERTTGQIVEALLERIESEP